jgi:acyl-homoserine lactone acylase PvdQ
LPIRRRAQTGAFIKDGTTSRDDWIGFSKANENPQLHNPAKGYVVCANNRFAPDSMLN